MPEQFQKGMVIVVSYNLQRTSIGDRIFFNSIIDKRYKTNRVSVNLILPLERDKASVRALIPNILRKGYRGCPDFTEFSKKLAMLYGSYIGYDVTAIGDSQVITLSAGVIDDMYALDGEHLLSEISEILSKVVLDPVLENGLFPEREAALEKQSLIDLIESEMNEKRHYALNRATAVLCAGEPAGVNKYGYVEDVKKITAHSVTQAYRELLETARVEIMFVGCGNPEKPQEIFTKAFAGISRNPRSFNTLEIKKSADALKEETEQMNVAQSKLVLGFRTGVAPSDHELNAMRLMISLYGGTPSSKLFLNVREKMSLCYYCAARPNVSKGIAFVDCGVEHQNIEKAKEEILNQLDQIRKGNFTDEDLNYAKLSMVNTFRSAGDSAPSIEGWYLSQVLYGTERSPEMEGEAIAAIDKDAVIAAANRMQLDTVYLLTDESVGK